MQKFLKKNILSSVFLIFFIYLLAPSYAGAAMQYANTPQVPDGYALTGIGYGSDDKNCWVYLKTAALKPDKTIDTSTIPANWDVSQRCSQGGGDDSDTSARRYVSPVGAAMTSWSWQANTSGGMPGNDGTPPNICAYQEYTNLLTGQQFAWSSTYDGDCDTNGYQEGWLKAVARAPAGRVVVGVALSLSDDGDVELLTGKSRMLVPLVFTVNAVAGPGGTISPTIRTVNKDDTTTFTVVPDAGYTASASGCNGSLLGNTYTTGPITSNCTVNATFTSNPSGTLSVTGCTIAANQSNCNASVTWTTSNRIPGADTVVTRNNPDNTVVSTAVSGTNVSETVRFGPTSFFLYHNGIEPPLASAIINVTCAIGYNWDGTRCANVSCPVPVISGINGYDVVSGEHPGVRITDTYLILYGAFTFSGSGNTVKVDGVSRAVSWQGVNTYGWPQINVALGAPLSQGNHSVTVTNDCGSTSSSSPFVVTAPPTVTLTADPINGASPLNSTITWRSERADSCVGTGGSGGWAGPKSTFGNYTYTNLTSTATYTYTCSNTHGSASASVTIMVGAIPPPNPLAPTVTLTADPINGASPLNSTITWGSERADSCVGTGGSGGWAGPKSTFGNYTYTNLTNTATYTYTCSNTHGSSSASVTITPLKPNLTAENTSPSSATSGVPVSLTSTIKNTGSVSTINTFWFFFQKSTDITNPSAIDDLAPRQMIALAPGMTRTATSIPNQTFSTGTHYIRACADKTDRDSVSPATGAFIEESDELDNCSLWTTLIVSPVGAPVVNGACATPPHGYSYASASLIPTPLCSSGTAVPSSLSGAGPWNWQCNGSGGGSNASCSAIQSVALCPSGSVNLSATSARVNAPPPPVTASVPAGFSGGIFKSSRPGIVSITVLSPVSARITPVAIGTTIISGEGWNYTPNGATNCSLSGVSFRVPMTPRPEET